MAEYANREHYIPLRRSDLVDLLCRELPEADVSSFRRFCALVTDIYHLQYHRLLEEMKDEYAPFDPDRVTTMATPPTAEERQTRLDGFFQRMNLLMTRANFIHLDHRALIDAAMREVSDWGVNMDVNFDVFEQLAVYVRGDTEATRSRRAWWKLYRKETVQLPTYQRLVLVVKLRPHAHLPSHLNTDCVFLKIFKDIPKVDLEMLLPGARLRMSYMARFKLGGSMVSGLGFIIYNIVQQILTGFVLAVQFFWAPLAALFGYGYKQWYGYSTTVQSFHLQLTQSLYYQNLDSNAGVLFHLLDEAEEQECREAILAYFYLWRHAEPTGWLPAQLDDRIEADLARLANIKVDFEIADAVDKLVRLNLLECLEHRFRARPIEEALCMLDEVWKKREPQLTMAR
jgi:Protein of unknown function (DUF3754)